jgi:rhodanese-related sulfurtransferase
MKLLLYLNTFLFFVMVSAQSTIPQVLKKLNKETVPYVKVEEIKTKNNIVFLDTREPKEYNVSHIEKAINVGFDKFDSKKIATTLKDKNAAIVVYCSIGVRSEKIGEKLLKLGYKNVYNLYGGIFEWKNNGRKVVTNQNTATDKIHTFNKEWSVYLKKGTKVYEN